VLDCLWLVTAGVQALFALRIWRVGLASRYPAVITYLIASPVLIVAGSVFRATSDPKSPNLIHGWFWVLTQPLSWILLFVVVVEIYNRILDEFAGFRALGRFAVGVATVLLAVLYLLMAGSRSLRFWSEFWQHQQQSLFVTLTLFCALIFGFVAYWEIPISRNVWLLIAPFGLMIGADAFFLSAHDLLGADGLVLKAYSVATPLFVIVSFGAGTSMFSTAGEEIGQRVARPDSSVLLDQVDAMNQVLERMLVR